MNNSEFIFHTCKWNAHAVDPWLCILYSISDREPQKVLSIAGIDCLLSKHHKCSFYFWNCFVAAEAQQLNNWLLGGGSALFLSSWYCADVGVNGLTQLFASAADSRHIVVDLLLLTESQACAWLVLFFLSHATTEPPQALPLFVLTNEPTSSFLHTVVPIYGNALKKQSVCSWLIFHSLFLSLAPFKWTLLCLNKWKNSWPFWTFFFFF